MTVNECKGETAEHTLESSVHDMSTVVNTYLTDLPHFEGKE